MRTKLTCLFIVLIAGLSACGKDDKDPVPQLTRLTKVTCYKNGGNTPLYDVSIFYKTTGEISHFNISEEGSVYTENVTYSPNKISLQKSTLGYYHQVYTLSGNRIIQTDHYAIHGSDVYESDTYYYTYEGVFPVTTAWITRWPDEEGNYNETDKVELEKYSWENRDLASFRILPSEIMEFEYRPELRPDNFPQRFHTTFDLTGFETLTPLNFSFGYLNKHLPKKGWAYNVSSPKQKLVEYDFEYTFDPSGYYVTKMIIEEENWQTGESNVYTYTFSY